MSKYLLNLRDHFYNNLLCSKRKKNSFSSCILCPIKLDPWMEEGKHTTPYWLQWLVKAPVWLKCQRAQISLLASALVYGATGRNRAKRGAEIRIYHCYPLLSKGAGLVWITSYLLFCTHLCHHSVQERSYSLLPLAKSNSQDIFTFSLNFKFLLSLILLLTLILQVVRIKNWIDCQSDLIHLQQSTNIY